MTAIIWDQVSARPYEYGIDRGVLYPKTGSGVAWNGITKVSEDVANAGQSVIYIDGERQVNKLALGEFSATLEAITYPDEFLPYDGYLKPAFTGQKRPEFNLSYRTMTDIGYHLHLVYSCLAKPTAKPAKSITTTLDSLSFIWGISTTPLALPYDRPTSHVFLDSTLVMPSVLSSVEDILYGSLTAAPRMLTFTELFAIFEATSSFRVVDNGDGTVTITGPDNQVFAVATNQYTISSPSLLLEDDKHIVVSSY